MFAVIKAWTEHETDGADASVGVGRAAVLARYDELAALLDSLDDRPVGDADLAILAATVIAREARLLDARRWSTWLDWFVVDAVVWVPLTSPAHPATDQSLYLDDRRRLAERVAWHDQPSSWGQHPPSVCSRVVGGVEAWREPDGRVVTAGAFTLHEHRHGEVQVLGGRVVHELVGDDLRCRSKITVVPQLADGLRNPSFLL